MVALTALAMKGDRERLLAKGFDGYLEKPIRYKGFLASVAAEREERMKRAWLLCMMLAAAPLSGRTDHLFCSVSLEFTN